MIPSLALMMVGSLAGSGAPSSTTDSSTTAPEVLELERFRMPFDALVDRTIGKAARPVGFDWRSTRAHVAAVVQQPVEFNNFQSFRVGVMGRVPTDRFVFEFSLSYVWAWGSASSEQLALTPFRQPGRPSRLELDVLMGLPLAEGVVTMWPAWFPAAELVLNAYFDFRYLLYPGSFSGFTARETLGALFDPKIGDRERENLEDARLPAMEVDSQRYGFYAGLGTDIYFDFGFFISPRVLFTVPLLLPATQSKMGFGMDFSLVFGAAF